jgi:hypothetical protein
MRGYFVFLSHRDLISFLARSHATVTLRKKLKNKTVTWTAFYNQACMSIADDCFYKHPKSNRTTTTMTIRPKPPLGP